MARSKSKLQLDWKRKGRSYYAEVGDRTIFVERMPFVDTLAYSWSGFGNLVSHKWIVAGATPAETKRHAEAAWAVPAPAEPAPGPELPPPEAARKRGRPALGEARKSNAERSRARRERRQAEMRAAIRDRDDALVLAMRLLSEFSAEAGESARQAFFAGGDGRHRQDLHDLAISLRKLGLKGGGDYSCFFGSSVSDTELMQ